MNILKRFLITIVCISTFSSFCYAQVEPFDYELFDDNEKACLIDNKGKKLTDFVFDKIEYIGDGYYLVEQNNMFGIIDYKGKTVINVIHNDKSFYNNDSIQYRLNRNYADSAFYKVRYDHTWRALHASFGRAFYMAKTPAVKLPLNHLQSLGNSLDFVSIAYKGPSNHAEDYGLEFKYFLPLSSSDSHASKLWGFQITNYWGANLVYIKDFDVPLSIGLNYGCLYYQTDAMKYYNPEVSLSLNAAPRFIYKRFILHASLGAQWDMSNGKWKSRSETSQVKMKSNLLSVGAGVAYMLFDYKSSYLRIYP